MTLPSPAALLPIRQSSSSATMPGPSFGTAASPARSSPIRLPTTIIWNWPSVHALVLMPPSALPEITLSKIWTCPLALPIPKPPFGSGPSPAEFRPISLSPITTSPAPGPTPMPVPPLPAMRFPCVSSGPAPIAPLEPRP